jgi:hypothetical protein
MEEFRLTITGATGEIEALEEFCRAHGITTERRLIQVYEGIAVNVFALQVIGRFEVLAQCIAAYGASQKPALKASYIVPKQGRRVMGDYSFEGVARALRETGQLHFDRDNKETRNGAKPKLKEKMG